MRTDDLLAANLEELITSNAAREREHKELLQRMDDMSNLLLNTLEQLRMLGLLQQPDFRGHQHLS